MAQRRLVVGFASNRQQAEAAAEQLHRLGLVPRVTERTGEAELPFAVAYYARSGREAARLEEIFEALEIEGDVIYEELPGDDRLVRVYSVDERPGALTMLANLMERAGLRVVRAHGELMVPRSQEPLALDVIRQFEQAWPKKRGLLGWFDEESPTDESAQRDRDTEAASEPARSAETSGAAEPTAAPRASAFAPLGGVLGLAAWHPAARDAAATSGPAVGQLPDAWPCCPSCRQTRDTQCPTCGETGSHFPPAELVPEEYVNNRPVPSELAEAPWPVLCPLCDWLFEPEFYRRCAWCGHDFGQGREVPLKSPMASEPLNLRMWLAVGLTVAIVVAVLAYLAIVSKARDPKVRPIRAVPIHGVNIPGANLHGVDMRGVNMRGVNMRGGIVAPAPHLRCALA